MSHRRTFNSRTLNDADRRRGDLKEREVLPKLIKHLGIDMKKTLNQYSPYDFENKEKKIRAELKSRTISVHSEYTTFMPVHKKNSKGDGRLYFVFDFPDGLFIIEYTEKLFNNFETVFMKNGNKETETFKIPIRLLTRIC